jgi:hypothetical protein
MRGERMSVNRDWSRIRDAAKLPADLTLRDLRHSVGTVAVIAGLNARAEAVATAASFRKVWRALAPKLPAGSV